jgi:hypothetical protein
MCARAALDLACPTDSEQDCSLWTMMGSPVCAGDFDIAISIRFFDLPPRLVTVATQVAHSAIIRYVLKCI